MNLIPLDNNENEDNDKLTKPPMLIASHLGAIWDYITCKTPDKDNRYFAPSYSSLVEIMETPLHFIRYIDKKLFGEREETDAMRFGAAVDNSITHYYFLGLKKKIPKSQLTQPYLVFQGDKRSNEQKQKYAELQIKAAKLGIPVLSETQAAKAEEAISALLNIKMEDDRALSPAQILVRCAIDTQIYLQLNVPNQFNFNGNVPIIRGIADAFGRNPNTAKYYVADLKKVPNANSYAVRATVRSRKFSIQLAIYAEALYQQGKVPKPITEFYNVVYDEEGNVNVFAFDPNDIKKALNLTYKACKKIDEFIEEGDPEKLLLSYTTFSNCALYIDNEIY